MKDKVGKRLSALKKYIPCIQKINYDNDELTISLYNYFLGIFNESTARALEFYAKDHKPFLETSRFVTFIMNVWKIISVKSKAKGMLIAQTFELEFSV